LTDPLTMPWRTGRKVGRTIYAQTSDEPSDHDTLIGVMDTRKLAQADCRRTQRHAREGTRPMILPKQQANAIASGRKTTHHTTNDALRVGARFNISYREGKQLVKTCYAQIVAREERALRDLTRDEAKREGYDGARGPLNFRRAWLEATQPAWGAKCKATGEKPTDEAVAILFFAHAGRPTYVLTLALAEEPDQWMARSSGRLTKHQATSNPRQAIDELPLAPQAFVDAEAKRIYEHNQTMRAQARRAQAADRFAHAEAQARAAGIDTRRAARSVEQIAQALERRTQPRNAT
jgi:hypothetical protein